MSVHSLQNLYRIGPGPSSSHTIAPMLACEMFKKQYPTATGIVVTLHDSLALTGKGHGTDDIILACLPGATIKHQVDKLNDLPNGMIIEARVEGLAVSMAFNSVGGGELYLDGVSCDIKSIVYPQESMTEILEYVKLNNITLYDYILSIEGPDFESFLETVLVSMFHSVEAGLNGTGYLIGELKLKKVARSLHLRAMNATLAHEKEKLLISAYAYAVSEQNAMGFSVVTAPTCGASGVLPAILYYLYHDCHVSKQRLKKALAIAGLFGNVVKYNASISGARGGCQAEVGTACSMASAAYAYIDNLPLDQIEYAAEIAMEHHLGLTCDPVLGYVQIPCIERNGIAALRVLDACLYAKHLGALKSNRVSFDMVVATMYQTGLDMKEEYRETALGGLAVYSHEMTEC